MRDVTELSAELEVQARGAGYLLLADLLARGPVEPLLAAARTSEALADALDSYSSLDDAQADHHDAFGFNVPPLMGAFVDPDGNAGGESAETIADTYAAIGYTPDPRAEEPEHLATMLRALGVLAGAEVDAMVDREQTIVREMRRIQAKFLREHLAPWLGLFTAAVERLNEAWPNALVHQIESLVELHRMQTVAYASDVEVEVDEHMLDLDDPDTDLRSIAHALSVPARSGIWLSKHDLKQVGRKHRLPRGFGSRALTIQNLLRSAIRFDSLAEMVDDLSELLRAQEARLEPGHPAVERCRHTRRVLERIAAEGVE